MMHECILHARIMGYKTTYTDHSLFGFADAASVNLNKVLRFTMLGVDRAIAVSKTCKENLALRASMCLDKIDSIPNAVDCNQFAPRETMGVVIDGRITVVVLSRLAYRKGIDLIASAIPLACARDPRLHFIVGGDGPKRYLLHEMMKRHNIPDRVEILGAVPHEDVPALLRRGSIFLNCSLTESFCIAILEAASCGLFVVSTRVGGVPEVLPEDMIEFAQLPSASSVADALERAISRAEGMNPCTFHRRIKNMYSWKDVALQTTKVYNEVLAMQRPSLVDVLRQYATLGGFFSGFLAVCVVAVDIAWMWLIEWFQPVDSIEVMPWVVL